ncbi:MAG: nicotinate-nucleotide pyrophosphorylase, partial [Dehalococcoidia bacterium]|nr:nicotinate-nucleotide pyrophosphorylase [Dehalococcoidia bacterium]
ILKAERTALNFLQRMSGIATETSHYIEAVAGLSARITDTRKTTPGLRLLEKYAVRAGGGVNHRLNLGDMVLIKDNHIAALRAGGMTLRDIILQARRKSPPGMKVEVEVTTAEEAAEAAAAGADMVMLDNMGIGDMHHAVKLVKEPALSIAKGKILIEASGGITLANVRSVAETGVDYISVGALTHSVRALDISLEMEG